MVETTDLDFDAIRARADAATPGPWDEETVYALLKHFERNTYLGEYPFDRHVDAPFIAHSRTDIPALLDKIAWLQREHDECVRSHQKMNAVYEQALDLLVEVDKGDETVPLDLLDRIHNFLESE